MCSVEWLSGRDEGRVVAKKLMYGAAVAALGALFWSATALAAGGSTLSGYNRPGGIQTQVQGASNGRVLGSGSNTVGSLPFTGVDLGIIARVALLLLALGWSLRRAGKRTA